MARHVNLHLSLTSKSETSKWTKVESGGRNFWYRFSGGGDDKGNQWFKVGKKTGFQVAIIGRDKHEFALETVEFSGGPAQDFSFEPKSEVTGWIKDTCENEGATDYTVMVKPLVEGGGLPAFGCHPVITNERDKNI